MCVHVCVCVWTYFCVEVCVCVYSCVCVEVCVFMCVCGGVSPIQIFVAVV